MRKAMRLVGCIFGSALLVGGCTRLEEVGRLPQLSVPGSGNAAIAMASAPFPASMEHMRHRDAASLWTSGRQSLLGDRRAQARGDILTVMIEIDDSANISNTSGLVDRFKENCCTLSYHIAHQFNKQCSENALSVSMMCCLRHARAPARAGLRETKS